MKNEIIKILEEYEEFEFVRGGGTNTFINCRNYEDIANDIVELYNLHDVIKSEAVICPICNVTELINGNCKTCTDELCKPAGQIVL